VNRRIIFGIVLALSIAGLLILSLFLGIILHEVFISKEKHVAASIILLAASIVLIMVLLLMSANRGFNEVKRRN